MAGGTVPLWDEVDEVYTSARYFLKRFWTHRPLSRQDYRSSGRERHSFLRDRRNPTLKALYRPFVIPAEAGSIKRIACGFTVRFFSAAMSGLECCAKAS
jgi:hypothetical protein